MNYLYPAKQEHHLLDSSTTSQHIWTVDDPMLAPPPQPMEGLHDTGPPPFLNKTYDMVDDPTTNQVVSWSRTGGSFVVWDPRSFVANILPCYFKHNNFSSFVRQLNTYGFRKVDPDRWEFANEGFSRGQKHLLKNIRRRKTPPSSSSSHQAVSTHHASLGPCVEVGRFGLDGDIDRLHRDKEVLMMELVKVRQELQGYRASLKVMEERLRGTERKQEQMMGFLARAMQNPAFLQQLVRCKEDRKEVEEGMTKKRMRPIDQGFDRISLVKAEVLEFGEGCYQMSELEALAMEMQGFGKVRKEPEEESESLEIGDKELDDGFWDELFSERFEGDMSTSSAEWR